jgi:hypothetical protein
MFGASTVLSWGGGSPQNIVLNPTRPAVIVDAGPGGASVATADGGPRADRRDVDVSAGSPVSA